MLVPPINAGPHATPRAHRRMVLLIVVVIAFTLKSSPTGILAEQSQNAQSFQCFSKGDAA